MRGTPVNDPFTDFENPIFANDRGGVIDLLANGRQRGFNLKFKSGNHEQPGAEVLFQMSRATNFCKVFCEAIGCSRFAPKDQGLSVFGADKKAGKIGSVRHSKQASFCEKLFRNRFNKRAKPLYDVLDAEGSIAYTIMVPLDKGAPFLGLSCLPMSYGDEDFLAVVVGPRTEERFGGAEREGTGWAVALQPRYAKTIDNCLNKLRRTLGLCNKLTCGALSTCMEAMTIIDKFCVFFKTLPVDNVTQVPHPGRGRLRCTFPCTRALTATRVCMPKAAGDTESGDKKAHCALVTAAIILMDLEGVMETL